MKSWLMLPAVAGAMLCAAPAMAQFSGINPSYYGTLGYSDFNNDSSVNLDSVTGRLGARLTPYLGAEGEVSVGVGNSNGLHLNDQYAGYGVAYLPLQPNLDLLARIGYGHSDLHVEGAGGGFGADSWNFGAGAEYFFDRHNGLRADYTREDFQCSLCGNANVWSISYVRKF